MIDTRFGTMRRHPELERLICAAMSNQHFASKLLVAPEDALALWDYRFHLSPTEQDMITSINGAADIYDFAARLHAKSQQPN